jgi:hypothetical protein
MPAARKDTSRKTLLSPFTSPVRKGVPGTAAGPCRGSEKGIDVDESLSSKLKLEPCSPDLAHFSPPPARRILAATGQGRQPGKGLDIKPPSSSRLKLEVDTGLSTLQARTRLPANTTRQGHHLEEGLGVKPTPISRASLGHVAARPPRKRPYSHTPTGHTLPGLASDGTVTPKVLYSSGGHDDSRVRSALMAWNNVYLNTRPVKKEDLNHEYRPRNSAWREHDSRDLAHYVQVHKRPRLSTSEGHPHEGLSSFSELYHSHAIFEYYHVWAANAKFNDSMTRINRSVKKAMKDYVEELRKDTTVGKFLKLKVSACSNSVFQNNDNLHVLDPIEQQIECLVEDGEANDYITILQALRNFEEEVDSHPALFEFIAFPEERASPEQSTASPKRPSILTTLSQSLPPQASSSSQEEDWMREEMEETELYSLWKSRLLDDYHRGIDN